jgi:hypothetical protein
VWAVNGLRGMRHLWWAALRGRYAGAMASDDEPDLPVDGEDGEAGDGAQADEVVDEMERESFPASDPPSTWAGRREADN